MGFFAWLLAILFGRSAPPPAPAPLPPPPPPPPVKPDFGFHFPECIHPETDLDKYYSVMKSLGATLVRIGVEWAYVEPQKGVYNFANINRYKEACQKAHAAGLSILLCIGNHRPAWETVSANDFGRHAAQVAEQFAAWVSTFEIWNELNAQHFWGNPFSPRLPSISEYAAFLEAAYRGIKSVNSNAKVYSGGYMACHGYEGLGTIDPLLFEQGLYQFGVSTFRDGVCNHPYPLTPNFQIERPTADQYFIKRHREIRQLMVDRGVGSQPLICSELGIPSEGAITEEQQAQWMRELLPLVKGPIYLYSLRDRDDKYGLYRADWTPKPVAEVVRQWAE